MAQKSLGLIEVVGLPAAIEAADAAVKSANVSLVGYELSKGGGMATVKVEGDVGAVRAAIDAAKTAASKVAGVVSVKVIARPSEQIAPLINSPDTVGVKSPPRAEEAAKAEEPPAPAVPKSPKKPAPAKSEAVRPAISVPSPSKPADKKPTVKKPAEKKPTEKKPAEKKPAEKKPAEKKPVGETPVEKLPVVETPVINAPVDETPVVKAPEKEPDK